MFYIILWYVGKLSLKSDSLFRSQYQCELHDFACTIYCIYIYMFLYYTYSEIVNMNYMKYIMYIIIYNIWIPCDLHKALHTGPFARILAGEWPVCMHPRGVAEENCRKWPIGSYTIAPHYAGNFQTTLKWFISQRKVDSLICHANGQLSSIIHILGCLGWALARPAR